MKGKYFLKWCFVILVMGLISFVSQTDEIPPEIILALKKGNSRELANFFNSEIELTLPDKEEVYSKAQAELIVKNFFAQYPPDDFEMLHHGSKDKTLYAIGTLKSGESVFRVYFLIKYNYNRPLIHQLRIETE